MRTIKFRAWDKKRKEYIYSGIDYAIANLEHYDGVKDPKLFAIFEQTDEERERFVLEQFTGLFDKNGKEIFDGDKIKVVSYTTMIGDGERIAFESRIYEVVSRKFAYMGKLTSYGMLGDEPTKMPGIISPIYHYLHEMTDDVEIIGNIHDNEEELK